MNDILKSLDEHTEEYTVTSVHTLGPGMLLDPCNVRMFRILEPCHTGLPCFVHAKTSKPIKTYSAVGLLLAPSSNHMCTLRSSLIDHVGVARLNVST